MCSKRGIIVVASGVTPRIDFMLRSHGASYSEEEEEAVKDAVYKDSSVTTKRENETIDRIILFMTVHEALEFCEATLIHQLHGKLDSPSSFDSISGPKEHTVSSIFAHLLGSNGKELEVLQQFDNQRYHTEEGFSAGQKVFSKDRNADAIYVVLKGSLASGSGRSHTIYRHRQEIVSGAGPVRKSTSKSSLFDPLLQEGNDTPVVATMWPAGGKSIPNNLSSSYNLLIPHSFSNLPRRSLGLHG
jgi:hypothetical protein